MSGVATPGEAVLPLVPEDLDTLLVMRIRGPLAAAAVAAHRGVARRRVAAHLAVLAEQGLVEPARAEPGKAEPPGGRWRITRNGRAACDLLLAEQRRSLDEAALLALYRRFVPLNDDAKAVLTTWQLRSEPGGGFLINTHLDSSYDEQVLCRLTDVHTSAQAWLADMAALVPSFDRRASLLDAAMRRALGGETEFVMSPWVLSFHSLWFELHEELLLLCGRKSAVLDR